MLELKNISRHYQGGEDVVALKDVSFKITDGEFIAIVGPSGCGKSTLLHIIGLLDNPDSGEYMIDCNHVNQLKNADKAKMRNQKFGFVFQSFNLLPRTSAFDNVILPLKYRKGVRRTEKVQAALESVGLWERRKSRPNQLSGGQQQRVAIARALVVDPQVILADEPTGNLDTKTGLEIMELFKTIHERGKTIIFVTHNDELLKFATRIVRMKDGQILNDTNNGKLHFERSGSAVKNSGKPK